MRLSKKLLLLFFPTILLLSNPPENAEALQLQVENKNANPGENITVTITVGGYSQEEIAAAAFTLTYNTDNLLLTSIDSDFFDVFQNQWNSLTPLPNPMPPGSVVVDGKTYDQPLLFNTSNAETLLVGARVEPGTPTILFTLNFTVNPEAPSAIYPVSISQSTINNAEAGYNPFGEVIPLLIGFVENQTDPLLAFPVYSPVIVNGAVNVEAPFVDDNGNGIDDNWEIRYFGNLTTATSTSDYDNDGYTDLQEYLNDTANETDPQGAVYDPVNIVNAPGGTGYRYKSGALPAIYLLLFE